MRRARLTYYWRRQSSGCQGEIGEVNVVCTQCDKPETQCECEKYCCFCQSQYNVRLCVDGLYYCPDCREACDVRVVEADAH